MKLDLPAMMNPTRSNAHAFISTLDNRRKLMNYMPIIPFPSQDNLVPKTYMLIRLLRSVEGSMLETREARPP